MARAVADTVVERPPAEALELWTDPARWPSFVDQLARVVEVGPGWPTQGSAITWESTPDGRGRVSEQVEDYAAPPPGPDVAPQSRAGRLATRVRDKSLTGFQTATFAPVPEGTRILLELDYELTGGGPLRRLTDFLFIRRAVRDSLERTLARFAAELSGESSIH